MAIFPVSTRGLLACRAERSRSTSPLGPVIVSCTSQRLSMAFARKERCFSWSLACRFPLQDLGPVSPRNGVSQFLMIHTDVCTHTHARMSAHTRTPYWSVSWALKRFCFVLSLFSKANQSFLLAKLVDSFFCRLFCGLCFVFVLKPCPSQHREGSRAGTGPWQEGAEKSVPSSRSCTGHIKTTLRRAV